MDKLSDIELSKTNIVKDVKFTDEKIGSNKLNLEDEVDQELDRLGQGGRWVWWVPSLVQLIWYNLQIWFRLIAMICGIKKTIWFNELLLKL